MQKKIQGSVWLEAVVTTKGDVGDVKVTRSLDAEYGLDQEAVGAAKQWKFKPGTREGKPVAVRDHDRTKVYSQRFPETAGKVTFTRR